MLMLTVKVMSSRTMKFERKNGDSFLCLQTQYVTPSLSLLESTNIDCLALCILSNVVAMVMPRFSRPKERGCCDSIELEGSSRDCPFPSKLGKVQGKRL